MYFRILLIGRNLCDYLDAFLKIDLTFIIQGIPTLDKLDFDQKWAVLNPFVFSEFCVRGLLHAMMG
jgi:hypothetical protein